MKKETTRIAIIAIFVFAVLSATCIFAVVEVNAQPTIDLRLRKDFGYSDFGNGAQGNWTAQAIVSDDIVRVEFFLDDSLQRSDTDAPFSWSYYTDNYPLGLHTIKAIAYDSEGNTVTAEKQQNFVEMSNATLSIVFAVVIIIIVVASIVLVVKMKKK